MKESGIRQDWRIDENSTDRKENEDGEREIRQDWRIDEKKQQATKKEQNNTTTVVNASSDSK